MKPSPRSHRRSLANGASGGGESGNQQKEIELVQNGSIQASILPRAVPQLADLDVAVRVTRSVSLYWDLVTFNENLKVKQDLMARIDAVRKPGTIVSSNTSGIPLRDISEGRSADFKQHFLGTHFFNPPRYLKLLEVIPTPNVALETSGPNAPGVVKPVGDENFIQVIMPMHLG